MESNHILKVFIVDDDEFFGNVVKTKLESQENIDVTLFSTARDFLNGLYQNPDLLIIDYDLPGKNGIEILEEVKTRIPDAISIILSGQKELSVVVDAYEKKADRYLIKDENALVELMQNIENFRKNIHTRIELQSLQNKIIEKNRYENIIGESPSMKNMFRLMYKVENINIPVLVTGANGTGKELVANALHYNSSRRRNHLSLLTSLQFPRT